MTVEDLAAYATVYFVIYYVFRKFLVSAGWLKP